MRLFLRVVRLLALLPMPRSVRIVEGLGLAAALIALRVSLDDPDAAGTLVFALLASLASLACAMRAAALAARADQHDLLRLVIGSRPLLTGLALTSSTRPLLLLLLPMVGLAAWGAGDQRLSLPVFLSGMACVAGLVGGLALGGRASDPDSAARWALPWHLLPYGLLENAPSLAPLSTWQGWAGMELLPTAATLMLLHVGAALLLPTHRQAPRLRVSLREVGCLLACAVGAVLLFAPVLLSSRHAHCHGSFTACKSNLKNVGTALEIYATDHAGYPARLEALTPHILRAIPTCPAAGRDTYRARLVGTAYTVVCAGENHADVDAPPNYPQFTSAEGLREK